MRFIPLAGEEPRTAPEEPKDEEEDSDPEETWETWTVVLGDQLRTVELALSPRHSWFAGDVLPLPGGQMSGRNLGEEDRSQKHEPLHETVDRRAGGEWIPLPQTRPRALRIHAACRTKKTTLIMERGRARGQACWTEMNPLLSVPAGDARETTLIVERGDGTRPATSDGDDPSPFGPRQGREGDVLGSRSALVKGRRARRGPERITQEARYDQRGRGQGTEESPCGSTG